MTDHDALHSICLVIELAADHCLETRIRRLIDAHKDAGVEPRTLVMNDATRFRLIDEIGNYNTSGYFWHPSDDKGPAADGVSWFTGIPILVKEFMPDMEVIVGV